MKGLLNKAKEHFHHGGGGSAPAGNGGGSATRIDLPAPPPAPENESPEPNLNPKEDLAPLTKSGRPGSVTASANDTWDARPWRGFGTSLAWFANWIGRNPQDQLDDMCDLLFDPVKGLGLNVVRYNIGGGADPAQTATWHDTTQRHKFVPGFLPADGAPYNWAADPYQRNVLLGAKARGANVFGAISYSPPAWMTVSGDVAGTEGTGKECNLRPDCFEKFADYLTEVLQHYTTAHGIAWDNLEPVNEPRDGGWKKGGRQEGCSFPLPELQRLLPLVRAAMERKGISAVMAATDSWAQNVARDLKEMSPQVVAQISEIHAHGYLMHQMQGGAPALHQHLYVASQYRLLQDVARRLNKEVWQTEWTFLRHSGHDLDLGLVMARYIVQAINFMDCVVWCYWQAIDATPRFSIVTIKWHPRLSNPHTKLKKFWVWKQMIAFIQPGSLRIIPTSTEESEHCVAAFYDPKRSLVSFTIVNQQARSFELTLHLQGFNTSAQSTIEVYRTSLTEDFAKLDVPEGVFATDVTLDFAPRSLTTVVFTNVTK